ncbi:hypothetical protein BCV69DRAFT_142685 [Microstroma glucosiphilum]|uniref:BZIP domain-containing protein n=1 Tax=Pseudomicrostroma glucosiphilum TaxID=1684307 RepID=A0A316UB53_9BASI|nr:hypothetical protein BCV69DRAFT_142685 [Pseudomicrostroma glucosiphilum]PWN22392.1 hypothetical protein BCV69DRAFT_142685 [Pseudomicrostroma glucosiphilum]
MDAVMQLAREASNHQYLPAAEQSGSSNGQQNSSGHGEGDQGHEQQGTSTTAEEPASGASGGGSGTGRGRRKAAPSNAYARGGRKRKLSNRTPPAAATQDEREQLATREEQAADEQAYHHDASTAAAWMQDRLEGQQQEQHQYDSYGYPENMAGPSDLAAATAAAAAAAAAATANNHRLPLPEDGAEEDQLQQQQQQQQQLEGSPPSQSASPSNRPLSSTKRAAQNRAAQRAFRERRDKHVKELETTAAQFAQIQADYATLQGRYAEAIALIDHLRRENEELRGGEAVEEGQGQQGGYAHAPAHPEEGDVEGPRAENPTEGLEAVASAAAGAARLAAASELRQQEAQGREEHEGGQASAEREQEAFTGAS